MLKDFTRLCLCESAQFPSYMSIWVGMLILHVEITHRNVNLSRHAYFTNLKHTQLHVYLSRHTYFTGWKNTHGYISYFTRLIIYPQACLLETESLIYNLKIPTGMFIWSRKLNIQVEKFPRACWFEPAHLLYKLKKWYARMSVWSGCLFYKLKILSDMFIWSRGMSIYTQRYVYLSLHAYITI